MSGNDRILQGKRILVTRARQQSQPFVEKIMALGGTPIEVPLLSFVPAQNREEIAAARANMTQFDWVVFTSANGVAHFFAEKPPYLPKIAAVGEKTYESIEQLGLKVDLMPTQYVAEQLVTLLKENVQEQAHVLVVRGNLARPIVVQQLRAHGAEVTDLIVYETKMNQQKRDQLTALILNKEIDIITFTSSSTATYFSQLLNGIDFSHYLEKVKVACIGPVTARTAMKCGIKVDIIAQEHTIDGLLAEILRDQKKEDDK